MDKLEKQIDFSVADRFDGRKMIKALKLFGKAGNKDVERKKKETLMTINQNVSSLANY